MKWILYACLAVLATVFFGASAFAQQTNYAGLNFTVDKPAYGLRPGVGAVLERQFTKRSGIEAGLYYRTYKRSGSITYTFPDRMETHDWSVAEQYLSLPVQYKFYSRIVNLAAGPVLDVYTGWRQRKRASSIKLEDYDIDPNFSVGIVTKVSKAIPLSEKFVLEPEVRFQPIARITVYRVGFGIAGKYKL